MLALLGALALAQTAPLPSGIPDAHTLDVVAHVSDDLSRVRLEVSGTWTPKVRRPFVPIVLGMERFRAPPDPLPAAMEPLIYPYGFQAGGLAPGYRVEVEGETCTESSALEDGSVALRCGGPVEAGETRSFAVTAKLEIPVRYGPFGRLGRQLTLGGRWLPKVSLPGSSPSRGRIHVSVSLPANTAAVVGSKWVPWVPERARHVVEVTLEDASDAPLLVLPPETVAFGRGEGALLFPRGRTEDPPDARRRRAELRVLEAGLAEARRAHLSTRLLLVEAPLRRSLARALEGGVVLVSDHAYRMPEMDRLDRFQDGPILREIFSALALERRAESWPFVAADALGRALVEDRLARSGEAEEDAFDVLGIFAFVPAVDSLLYAPQIPFVGAYFHVIDETDPLRISLSDFPSERPRGKVLYEKLVDRVGRSRALEVFLALHPGGRLEDAMERVVGDTAAAFLSTWLGPYPALGYALEGSTSKPRGDTWLAQAEIARTGDIAAEPIEVRLVDAEGHSRIVTAPATDAPSRTVTATLAAPLASVTLDPRGRLAQRSTESMPHPALDDRSHPGWRVLLDSFAFTFGATAAALDTGLSFRFARQYDPSWSFGLSASYAPDTISATLRGTHAFGRVLTPNRRAAWLTASLTGERLQGGFLGDAGAGWSAGANLTLGWDDRSTVWAPEAGLGLRARLGYRRLLGLEGADTTASTDSVSLSLSGQRSLRIDAAHTLAARARVDAWVLGRPRPQLEWDTGGPVAFRGYRLGDERSRGRALVGGEWLHRLLRDAEVDVAELLWVDDVDGALFADMGVVGDALDALSVRADVGYGVRFYLSYLGVRPGVMALDFALPLIQPDGRLGVGGVEIWLSFSQSYFAL